MKFLLFTKSLAHLTLPQLADLASTLSIDGYDLCVREGHHIQPDNVQSTLPQAADILRSKNLTLGMVSAPPNFTDPDAPLAHALCAAMAQSRVPLLKIGYFPFNPEKHDYAQSLDAALARLAKWRDLARAHNITVCYHTHANYLGSSAGVLSRMLAGFDPKHLAAYLDPAQLLIQGEGFPAAMAILKNHTAAIGLKDVFISRTPSNDHGISTSKWVHPGQGMVDWTRVSQSLARTTFNGVVSAHVLMHETTADKLDTIAQEVRFYRQFFKENPA